MTHCDEPLSNFLVEYKALNANGQYKPVAVGKYGIRSRESIYSKELAKDYSKNKVIYKDTLTIGMGTNQIDIGVLTSDVIYSVSSAYHTYKIHGINSKYLDYCLRYRNPDMFTRYAKRGARQGKSIDLKAWLTYKIPVYNQNYQEFICETLDKVLDLRNKCGDLLLQMEGLIKSQFIEMFDPLTNKYNYPIVNISKISNSYFAGGDKPTVFSKNQIGECIYPVYSNGEDNLGLQGFTNKYRVDKEAVTISARGSIGFSCIREPKFTPIVRLITIIPNHLINIYYLKYLFDYSVVRSNGSSQQQFTIPELKKMSFILAPLNKQDEFASFVNQIDKSKFRLKELQEKLDTLYKSLLQKYFG